MKKLIVLLSLILIGINTHGQARHDLSRIIAKIVAINEVQYEFIGEGGGPSDNYKNYITLKDKADTSQLLNLTNDTNAVVACYAGWALIEKGYKNLTPILNKFIQNDRYVGTFNGCIRSADPLSSEFYHKYWNSISNELKATDKLLFELDSIILYNNTYWLLTLRALEDRVYPKSFHRQIEYLAFEKNNRDAILYLSNWYKADYRDRLKDAFIKYLEITNFSTVGVNVYYETVEELLKLRDDRIRDLVIAKLKKDTFWKNDEKEFRRLLESYSIYSID